MRHLLAFLLMIALVGSVAAADLGNVSKDVKINNQVGMNPGTPDGREGGENIGSATPIASMPYNDTGNTYDNVHDYDVICPYSGSTSEDVVYSYTPAVDEVISVDLCGSGYDTKTYVLDSNMNEVACNDDFYFDEVCGTYVSFIEEAFLTAGMTYYIIIDGYGGDAGDYVLGIEAFEPPPPCIIDCGDDEGEPAIVDGYLDAFNGGCDSPEFGAPFREFPADPNGYLFHCGQSGWYITAEGGNSRDSDWYIAFIGEFGFVEWTLDAEQESYGFLLDSNDCATMAVVDQMLVGPCAPQTMIIQGDPGDMVWLCVAPSVFVAPDGFVGNEYNYTCEFTGLEPGSEPTGVEEEEAPRVFKLEGCYPNPFNPKTTIAFSLPVSSSIRLNIYDVSGRLVRTLVDDEQFGVGRHELVWKGLNHFGQQVSSGVYFYRLDADGFSDTKRMVLVK